jgi:hypothetical protein
MDEFLQLTKKINSYNVKPIDEATTKNLLLSFNVINAAIVFVEQTLKDTSKFDFKK